MDEQVLGKASRQDFLTAECVLCCLTIVIKSFSELVILLLCRARKDMDSDADSVSYPIPKQYITCILCRL